MDFCENCHDIREFSIKEEAITKVIEGREITYNEKIAFCNKCGEEIFVDEIRDQNLKLLDIAYMKQEKPIQISDLVSILEKYNIDIRSLSMLLNWGEGTLTRYLDGDIPTEQCSETLRLLLEDPQYMAKILEENKDKITDRTYKLCQEGIKNVETDVRDDAHNQMGVVFWGE